jgi:hypothetical protein
MTDLARDYRRAASHAHSEKAKPCGRATVERLPTRQTIIDAMVAQVTYGRFKGDKRDGEPPPPTLENSSTEMLRHYARAYRERLMRLPYVELCLELRAGFIHVAELDEMTRNAWSKYQSANATGSRLQQAILDAARHFRDKDMIARSAWATIARTSFKTAAGHVVEIVGNQRDIFRRKMRVRHADGRRGREIGFNQWEQEYWRRCQEPSCQI